MSIPMKMTIYVPDLLAQRMRQRKSINWSAIAQQAFADRLGLEIVPPSPSRMVVKRRKK